MAAAVAIADREGLDAVTMRRLASELGTGTTSLYRYIADKDELLELMLDAAYGTRPASIALTGGWRADLRTIADALRELMLDHPWLMSERVTRPAFGPNFLARMEQALAAVAPLSDDATHVAMALTAVLDYVSGVVSREVAEREAHRRSGLDLEQWRAGVAPVVRQVIATGEYPELTRRIVEADDPSPAEQFAFGLNRLLDGISPPGAAHHNPHPQ